MNTTEQPETPAVASPVVDFRESLLGELYAPAVLDRLRPDGGKKIAVAAFNASL